MKRRVGIVVASRANYGRIKSVMQAVKEHKDLELVLIVGASALLNRFGKAANIIEQDGFKIDARVYSIVEGENLTTMAKSTGLGIIEMATLFEHLRPDIVVTVADRFETMSTAIAASYMNIPVAHSQGGEVTGSIDESVRHAITKLSHQHYVTTEKSRERVLRMGEEEARVHLTGCPALDAIAGIDLSLPPGFFTSAGGGGVGVAIDPSRPYLVVLQHPVTTEYGSGRQQIEQTIKAVSRTGMQAVWLWPNPDAGSDDISKALRVHRERNPDSKLHFYINFSVEDYARLIKNCACLVGNSSSGIREGAFLGVPAVNIGTRQTGRERGPNLIDAPYDADAIYEAIQAQLKHGPYPPDHLYGDGNAGKRIADLLATADLSVQKLLTY
jgi:UDP-hydrolysing UDP-N-acetyl-D-glucosamine 2-epimerase